MQTYRNLVVWQRGVQLVKAVYQLTDETMRMLNKLISSLLAKP